MPSINYIDVSPVIWDWVSQTITLSEVLNEEYHGLFAKWNSGKKQPTFNQLEEFSKRTKIPFGYFFLHEPPTETCNILQYRTIDSIALQNPSRNLIDTVKSMEEIQDWMREHLLQEGVEPISFAGKLNCRMDTKETARYIRDYLGINETWYSDYKDTRETFKAIRFSISDMGVLVMLNGIVGKNTHRGLDINEFRAFTLFDDLAPLIFINGKDSNEARLFSLLHELVHIGIGKSSFYNSDDWVNESPGSLEAFCNKVAAEIIAPERQFLSKWNVTTGDAQTKIKQLAAHFRCSYSVIARRAYDIGMISTDDFIESKNIAKQKAGQSKKKDSGGNQLSNLLSRNDHRFLNALHSSIREGRTLYTEAFRLTSTGISSFDGLMNRLRGGEA